MSRSSLRDGWYVLKRAPAVIFAEITWRWTFGFALWAILYYSFREYFASVAISSAEYALLRDLEPYTWMAVVTRAMVAFVTGFRIVGPIVIPALIILWIVLATVGRAGIIRALASADPQTNWVSSAALNLARVVLATSAFLAFFGCGILVNVMLGDTTQHFPEAVLLMMLFMTVIAVVWGTANWFLAVAPIFAATECCGFWSSLGQTASLYRRHRNAFLSTGIWITFARSMLIVAVTIASLAAFAGPSPARSVGLVIVFTFLYFAVADALNMWRLAAYISFTEPEPSPAVTNPFPPIRPFNDISSPLMDNAPEFPRSHERLDP